MLKGLQYHRCLGVWSVVSSVVIAFWGDWDDGEGLGAGHRGVKNVSERWSQVISAVLHVGGRDRVRSSCLAGLRPLGGEPVDVPFLHVERRHCSGGGGVLLGWSG